MGRYFWLFVRLKVGENVVNCEMLKNDNACMCTTETRTDKVCTHHPTLNRPFLCSKENTLSNSGGGVERGQRRRERERVCESQESERRGKG